MKVCAFGLVLTKTERLSIGTAGFCQSTRPPQQVSAGGVKQMVIGKRLLHLRPIKQRQTDQGTISHRDRHYAVQLDYWRRGHPH